MLNVAHARRLRVAWAGRLVPLVAASSDLRLSGALAAAGDAAIGQDAGVARRHGAARPSASPATRDQALAGRRGRHRLHAADAVARACPPLPRADRVPLVIGTTGHDATARAELREDRRVDPVVLAPNMSLGVNLLFKLAELAARALGADYDAEIVEAHHRHKVDAPSGTALGLGRAVARGRGTTLEQSALPCSPGRDRRRARAAGSASPSCAAATSSATTAVIFAGPGEQVELAHHAEDRSGFARGALVAARWVVGRPPGLYSMMDVLGL